MKGAHVVFLLLVGGVMLAAATEESTSSSVSPACAAARLGYTAGVRAAQLAKKSHSYVRHQRTNLNKAVCAACHQMPSPAHIKWRCSGAKALAFRLSSAAMKRCKINKACKKHARQLKASYYKLAKKACLATCSTVSIIVGNGQCKAYHTFHKACKKFYPKGGSGYSKCIHRARAKVPHWVQCIHRSSTCRKHKKAVKACKTFTGVIRAECLRRVKALYPLAHLCKNAPRMVFSPPPRHLSVAYKKFRAALKRCATSKGGYHGIRRCQALARYNYHKDKIAHAKHTAFKACRKRKKGASLCYKVAAARLHILQRKYKLKMKCDLLRGRARLLCLNRVRALYHKNLKRHSKQLHQHAVCRKLKGFPRLRCEAHLNMMRLHHRHKARRGALLVHCLALKGKARLVCLRKWKALGAAHKKARAKLHKKQLHSIRTLKKGVSHTKLGSVKGVKATSHKRVSTAHPSPHYCHRYWNGHDSCQVFEVGGVMRKHCFVVLAVTFPRGKYCKKETRFEKWYKEKKQVFSRVIHQFEVTCRKLKAGLSAAVAACKGNAACVSKAQHASKHACARVAQYRSLFHTRTVSFKASLACRAECAKAGKTTKHCFRTSKTKTCKTARHYRTLRRLQWLKYACKFNSLASSRTTYCKEYAIQKAAYDLRIRCNKAKATLAAQTKKSLAACNKLKGKAKKSCLVKHKAALKKWRAKAKHDCMTAAQKRHAAALRRKRLAALAAKRRRLEKLSKERAKKRAERLHKRKLEKAAKARVEKGRKFTVKRYRKRRRRHFRLEVAKERARCLRATKHGKSEAKRLPQFCALGKNVAKCVAAGTAHINAKVAKACHKDQALRARVAAYQKVAALRGPCKKSKNRHSRACVNLRAARHDQRMALYNYRCHYKDLSKKFWCLKAKEGKEKAAVHAKLQKCLSRTTVAQAACDNNRQATPAQKKQCNQKVRADISKCHAQFKFHGSKAHCRQKAAKAVSQAQAEFKKCKTPQCIAKFLHKMKRVKKLCKKSFFMHRGFNRCVKSHTCTAKEIRDAKNLYSKWCTSYNNLDLKKQEIHRTHYCMLAGQAAAESPFTLHGAAKRWAQQQEADKKAAAAAKKAKAAASVQWAQPACIKARKKYLADFQTENAKCQKLGAAAARACYARVFSRLNKKRDSLLNRCGTTLSKLKKVRRHNLSLKAPPMSVEKAKATLLKARAKWLKRKEICVHYSNYHKCITNLRQYWNYAKFHFGQAQKAENANLKMWDHYHRAEVALKRAKHRAAFWRKTCKTAKSLTHCHAKLKTALAAATKAFNRAASRKPPKQISVEDAYKTYLKAVKAYADRSKVCYKRRKFQKRAQCYRWLRHSLVRATSWYSYARATAKLFHIPVSTAEKLVQGAKAQWKNRKALCTQTTVSMGVCFQGIRRQLVAARKTLKRVKLELKLKNLKTLITVRIGHKVYRKVYVKGKIGSAFRTPEGRRYRADQLAWKDRYRVCAPHGLKIRKCFAQLKLNLQRSTLAYGKVKALTNCTRGIKRTYLRLRHAQTAWRHRFKNCPNVKTRKACWKWLQRGVTQAAIAFGYCKKQKRYRGWTTPSVFKELEDSGSKLTFHLARRAKKLYQTLNNNLHAQKLLLKKTKAAHVRALAHKDSLHKAALHKQKQIDAAKYGHLLKKYNTLHALQTRTANTLRTTAHNLKLRKEEVRGLIIWKKRLKKERDALFAKSTKQAALIKKHEATIKKLTHSVKTLKHLLAVCQHKHDRLAHGVAIKLPKIPHLKQCLAAKAATKSAKLAHSKCTTNHCKTTTAHKWRAAKKKSDATCKRGCGVATKLVTMTTAAQKHRKLICASKSKKDTAACHKWLDRKHREAVAVKKKVC